MTEQVTSAGPSADSGHWLGTGFVSRECEIARIQTFLDRALAGQGQICFVIGEAGDGKTALVTEFARRAQVKHDDLVVAIGLCDPQTGVGTPYLPFRELMEMLTGDTEGRAGGFQASTAHLPRDRPRARRVGQSQ